MIAEVQNLDVIRRSYDEGAWKESLIRKGQAPPVTKTFLSANTLTYLSFLKMLNAGLFQKNNLAVVL